MNIYFCNINNINENVEDFVIAKSKIEKPLLDKEEIKKKMSIKEFIEYIDLTKNIYILNDSNNSAIPFNIYTNKNEYIIIYSSINNSDNSFKEYLENINYDLNNLKQISELKVINGELDNTPYFIIDNKFYIS